MLLNAKNPFPLIPYVWFFLNAKQKKKPDFLLPNIYKL